MTNLPKVELLGASYQERAQAALDPPTPSQKPDTAELAQKLETWRVDSAVAAQQEEIIQTRIDKHNLLHSLWTKAVGTENYNKAEWKALEFVLEGRDPPTNLPVYIGKRAYAKEELAAELKALDNWRWLPEGECYVMRDPEAKQPTWLVVSATDGRSIDAGDTPEEAIANAREHLEGRTVETVAVVTPGKTIDGQDAGTTLTKLNDQEYVYRGIAVDAIHARIVDGKGPVDRLSWALSDNGINVDGIEIQPDSLRITNHKDQGPRGIAFKAVVR